MKAFLLAMGESNPLEAMDPMVPSPMIPLLNRPVMQYSVDLLYQNGIRDVYITIYSNGEQIEQCFGDGERWRVNFEYLLQQEPLGTAGVIRKAKYHIDDTFIVLPADSIIDIDLTAALAYHRESGGIATAILQSSPGFSIGKTHTVSLASNGAVVAVGGSSNDKNSTSDESYCDTGVYIFEAEVLEHIPLDVRYDCSQDLLPALLEAGKVVSGYVNEGYWNPLDTFSAYQHAQRTLFDQLISKEDDGALYADNPYIYARQGPAGVWRDKGTYVHPRATIHPPVYIGTGSQLLADSEIGPNVVVGPYAVVSTGTSIKNSTVLGRTIVGQLLDIENRVVNKSCLIDMRRDEITYVDNSAVLTDANPSILSGFLARCIEKSIGLLLFFLASPLLLLIALISMGASEGTIFTRVERIGCKPKNILNRSFSEPETIYLTRFQTRLPSGDYTKVGQWLEQWEMNRLPELWDVLRGELSLVGVEPLRHEESRLIIDEWQTQRYRCAAGFTGSWYTETVSESDLIERNVVDVYYAVNHSSSSRLTQLFNTPKVWLSRKIAYFGKTSLSQQQNIKV